MGATGANGRHGKAGNALENLIEGPDSGNKPADKQVSKRSRRAKPNDKNKWPQHPKIQSMDAREKAYLRVAGLGTTKKDSQVVDPKLDLMSSEAKFLRLLGGTSQRTRHSAVQKLKAYLEARCDIGNDNGGLSENDLLKLWKGLWYTLYMADKAPVQYELSKRLAELIWCVAGTEEEDEYAGQAYMNMCEEEEAAAAAEEGGDVDMLSPEDAEDMFNNSAIEYIEDGDDDDDDEAEEDSDEDDERNDGDDDKAQRSNGSGEDENENEESELMAEIDQADIPHCRGAHLASLFIRTFLRTLHREWGKMDKYRIDKFYTLLRLYIHEVYKYMALRHWNAGIIRLFNDCIFEEILNKTPNGLRYHFIDVSLEELAKVNKKAGRPLTEATFLDTMEPYFAMAQTGGKDSTGTIHTRVMENILEKFLLEYSVVGKWAEAQKEKMEDADDDATGESGDVVVLDQVHVATIGDFIFELASHPGTREDYRKQLYDMHKQYARRIKCIGHDVELNQIESNEGDEEAADGQAGDKGSSSSTKKECSKEDGGGDGDGDNKSSTKKGGKKKKKGKKGKGKAGNVETDKQQPVVDPVEDIFKSGGEKKSKKKEGNKANKKKKRAESALDTANGDNDAEEEIVITMSEQKKAKKGRKAGKKSDGASMPKSKKAKHASQDDDDASEAKRVKFTAVNKSRSYTASMRGLNTKLPLKAELGSPSKSILRKSPKHSRKKRQVSRRKASSYF